MAIDYNPNGTAFATAGKDNVVRIYDEETKKVAHELNAIKWHKPGHNNRIFSLKFKKDEPDLLVSGGWDQNVTSSSTSGQYLGHSNIKCGFFSLWPQDSRRFPGHQIKLPADRSQQRQRTTPALGLPSRQVASYLHLG